MKIEKEYDVQELANELKESIEDSFNREARNVSLDVITAHGIVDVLEMVASKGEFIMCRVEEAPKETHGTLCDDCLMSCCCNADCANEHITKQMLGDLVKCFGKRRMTAVCIICKYAEQCEVLTKHE